MLSLLGRASFVLRLYRTLVKPVRDWLIVRLAAGARRAAATVKLSPPPQPRRWPGIAILAIAAAGLGFGVYRVCLELGGLNRLDGIILLRSAAATFVRVNLALLIGAIWTVPAGVAIGFSPRLARIAQPLAQIAASVPATALFPVILLFFVRMRNGMELAAMLLMLLGTQWYILFNVIAGAMAIPTDLKEAAAIFRFSSWERWRRLILPGIFPYLITGLLTASGGAWNASIIAEYFHFQGRILSTTGLGQHHQPRERSRKVRSSVSRDDLDGRHRGADEPSAVAQALQPGFHTL